MGGPHHRLRIAAALMASVFVLGCTRQVVRPPVSVRHFALDPSALSEPLEINRLKVRSLVLTPSVWPLEGSVKRLLRGDFIGVFTAFDLSFRSTRIPDGVLEQIYDEDLLPVYLRIMNDTDSPLAFDPSRLSVTFDGGAELYPVRAEDVPRRFSEIDWASTAGLVIVALLVVVLVIAGADDNPPSLRLGLDVTDAAVRVGTSRNYPRGSVRALQPPAPEQGLLRAEVLKPGATREGFMFFTIEGLTLDWESARLTAN